MSKKIKDEVIKINHPSNDGTHVLFTNPTPRQKEILEHYIKLTKPRASYADDWHKAFGDNYY
jgi:hypothetical protein